LGSNEFTSCDGGDSGGSWNCGSGEIGEVIELLLNSVELSTE
jgi:hypothetical protein